MLKTGIKFKTANALMISSSKPFYRTQHYFFSSRSLIQSPDVPVLTDNYERNHTYLRISLTERCNLRCTYCMPEEGVPLTPKENILTTPEILKLASLFVKQGVNKIRLTGGEPSIRPDIQELIVGLSELKENGLKSIGMTSNGIALKRKLPQLVSSGLTSLNVSLDTLDPFKYQLMTRRKGFEKVMECLIQAEKSEIEDLKINCVVIRGLNDGEILDFVRLTENRKISVRFIEYMPFSGNRWDTKKLVPYKELLEKIKKVYPNVYKVTDDPNDTTKHFKVKYFKGNFGFITSMSENFCSTCNRLRITADGNLKVCLFGNAEISLRDMLRSSVKEEDILTMISLAVKKKKPRHAVRAPSRLYEAISYRFSLSQFWSSGYKILASRCYTSKPHLSHIDHTTGRAKMVDVGNKEVTRRIASAQAVVKLSLAAFIQIQGSNVFGDNSDTSLNLNKKGDVLTVAQRAGIQAAKSTSLLIPLCHPLSIDKIDIDFNLSKKGDAGEILINSTVACFGKTGVEMEALTAASVTALTIFDMCKAVDPSAIISDIFVLSKSGGKSDNFENSPSKQ